MPSVYDVVIAGGGPAGAVAAVMLCRAGARVAVFDRARFPRRKLCGDTVNPGTLARLQRLGLGDLAGTHAVAGMIVTGAGVRIEGFYPDGVSGRAIARRDLDERLLKAAAAAGADIYENTLVRGVSCGRACVEGLVVKGRDDVDHTVRARLVIAADGKESRLARSVGLARHPARPRRWAVGGYFENVSGLTACGEMHLRSGHYVGVAALSNGLANACVVWDDAGAVRDPPTLVQRTVGRDPELRERFANARIVGSPVVLGPLAVECSRAGMPGMLLAGDAAGFIDPMTGDGLRFAIRGAELAAHAALDALAHGTADAHHRLERARRREFGAKWRFNRALRRLSASPASIRVAATIAALVPSCVERAVLYAGDVGSSCQLPASSFQLPASSFRTAREGFEGGIRD